MPITSTRDRTWLPLSAAAVALALSACGAGRGDPAADDTPASTTAREAAPKTARADGPAAPRPVPHGELGTITAIVPLQATESPSGAGAVIGGVVGGALGNQVGKGDGRKAATVLGVIGGAAVGNQIEKDRNTRVTGYRIDIRLDNGRTTSVTTPQIGDYASGQRVRMVDGGLQRA